MKYRKDVQMLRGVAVLLVVMFHLGIPGFGSGFLGVDVFFVISGYLMAMMYTPDDKAGFFIKRSRRLLPAYFATVTATLLACVAITTPNDFGQVATQAWFAALFASNIGFWLENSYFDKASFKPLLHLWSLGVEIQFYALVPALYFALKRSRFVAIASLAAVSLAACLVVVHVSPKTSFFWLPFRLWEFLLGFSVAKSLPQVRMGRSRAGVLGLVVILLVPALPVSGEQQSMIFGHPGLIAFAISLATAAVIALGLPSRVQTSWIGSMLERLGNWSYSIYLAHFPVIVLMLYRPFSGTALQPASSTQLALVLLAVVVASSALYTLVEKPLRHGQWHIKWLSVAGVSAVFVSSAGATLQAISIPTSERAIYSAWEDRAAYRCGKSYRVFHPTAKICQIAPETEVPTKRILLVGNSHADSIKTAFAEVAAAHRMAVFLTVDNAPLIGGMTASAVLREAAGAKADAIVLHYSPGSVRLAAIEELARLARMQGIRVAFIMPVPVWERHVPQMLWAAVKTGVPTSTQTRVDYETANTGTKRAIEELQWVRLYDLAGLLCAPSCKITTDDGRPLYFDSGHLTLTGASLLKPVFEQVISDIETDSTRGGGSARAASPRLSPQ